MAGYFEPNSFNTTINCYYCGSDNLCTELNIKFYFKLEYNSSKYDYDNLNPFIFCEKCGKYNKILDRIPVIVRDRILERKRSVCTICNGCNIVLFLDNSIPYLKKWYHLNSYRLLTCNQCLKDKYFKVEDIPPVILKGLLYHDQHMSR